MATKGSKGKMAKTKAKIITTQIKSFAWRSGLIGFGREIPKGALPILDSNGKPISRRRLDPLARHAYDGKSLLVPGVPEAEDDMTAMLAFERWVNWIRERNPE